jgi:hypothetical protein
MTKRVTENGNVGGAEKEARGAVRTRGRTGGTVTMARAAAVGVVREVRVSRIGKEAGEKGMITGTTGSSTNSA